MIAQYGFQSIKLKAGALPPEQEAAGILALADAFPGTPLRIDPNGNWTVETSLKIVQQLQGVLEYYEDPAPGLDGMAAVARECDVPLATNIDRKSTRLNSSHLVISYAVFCLKKNTMLAVQADGQQVTTVEALAAGGTLHPIQAAFKQEHGLQCGFCTPGMMLTSIALLQAKPDPTDEDIRWALSGNICRCTGYMNIVKAVKSAADPMKAAAAVPAATAAARS